MDTAIVTTYCLIDDWLRSRRHKESAQRRVFDAEVMTTAITAARFFGGNFESASDLLAGPAYFGQRLSRSHFNRRRAKKRLPARVKHRLFQPTEPNQVWSLDYIHDSAGRCNIGRTGERSAC